MKFLQSLISLLCRLAQILTMTKSAWALYKNNEPLKGTDRITGIF